MESGGILVRFFPQRFNDLPFEMKHHLFGLQCERTDSRKVLSRSGDFDLYQFVQQRSEIHWQEGRFPTPSAYPLIDCHRYAPNVVIGE